MTSSKKKRRPAAAQPADPQKPVLPSSRRGAVKREKVLLNGRRNRLVLGGVLLVTGLAFLNSLDGQFVYDDRLQVLKNPAITRFENIPKMFTQSVWQFLNEADQESAGPYYRPLFNIALTINYGLFGLEVAGLASLLASGSPCCDPARIRSGPRVDIVARTGSRCGFAVRGAPGPQRVGRVGGGAARSACGGLHSFFTPALRARPPWTWQRPLSSGVQHPVCADGNARERSRNRFSTLSNLPRSHGPNGGRSARRNGVASHEARRPFLSAHSNLPRVALLSAGFIAQTEATAVGIPTVHVIATLPSILLSYARMLFLPFPLSVMYDNTYVTSFGDSRFWAPALAIAALLVAALWLTRDSTVARRSLVMLVLFLLPVLNLKAFRADESLLHDRYLYMPSIGFCLLIAMAIGWLAAHFPSENRRLLPGATAALALVLFALTVNQNRHWQSEDAMTSHALEVAPEWPFLHNYIGAQYTLRNRMTEGERAYQKALSINPRYYDSLSNLGDVYRQQGRFDEAAHAYNQAIECGAPYADTHFNLGVTYTSQGKLAQAEEPLRRAIELRPGHRGALYNLGWVYDNQDKRAQAEEAYVNTLRRDPSYVEPRINLGVLLTKQGRYGEALEQLQAAQRLAPDNSVMMYALGDLYMRTSRYRDAVDMLNRLATREPSHRLVHTALGLCYENLGEKEQAKARFQRAIEVAPQDPYTSVARERLAKI